MFNKSSSIVVKRISKYYNTWATLDVWITQNAFHNSLWSYQWYKVLTCIHKKEVVISTIIIILARFSNLNHFGKSQKFLSSITTNWVAVVSAGIRKSCLFRRSFNFDFKTHNNYLWVSVFNFDFKTQFKCRTLFGLIYGLRSETVLCSIVCNNVQQYAGVGDSQQRQVFYRFRQKMGGV